MNVLPYAVERRIWQKMRGRCNTKRNPDYPYYGGRGIAVCARWQYFENFLADMGKRPSPKHMLERVNNNGDYEPANVIWATADVQNRNKRNNVNLTANGQTKCLADWSKETGLKASTIKNRLQRGYPDSVALMTGVVLKSRPIAHYRAGGVA